MLRHDTIVLKLNPLLTDIFLSAKKSATNSGNTLILYAQAATAIKNDKTSRKYDGASGKYDGASGFLTQNAAILGLTL